MIQGNKFSSYNTFNVVNNYFEIKSFDDIVRFFNNYSSDNIKFLGNGSNILFFRKKVKSIILKNNLPRYINDCGNGMIQVSSSNSVQSILKYCENRKLDSFYYLSSVPATIGGAVAMNAGRGKNHNLSILDFVIEVIYIDKDGSLKNVNPRDMCAKYRSTIFSKKNIGFIVSVKFQFKDKIYQENLIRKRIIWARENQDYSGSNCGSVFKIYNSKIMKLLMGFKFCGAQYSPKTINWIINYSNSSNGVLFLVVLAKTLHFLLLQRCELEIKIII